MKKFPVQKKNEIGRKYVKLSKDELNFLKEVKKMPEKNINVCPHCGNENFLKDDLFKGMVADKLFEGKVTCRECYKLVDIKLTKTGELISVKPYEVTVEEMIRLDF